MHKNIRSLVLMAALAVILVAGVVAQQKADTAIDPVCGMTVVKANAKATFDYKGSTYYFCNAGCKEAFAKEPEKYLKAQQAKGEEAKTPSPMGQMGHMSGQMGKMDQAGMMKDESMAGCPMMGQNMPMAGRMGQMGMMRGNMGMRRPGMMAPGMGQLFMLYGDKIEMAVENTKDGAVLKVTSKDPEVIKAVQVHMAEHMAMMKKMKEAPAKMPAPADKMSESASCANCPMMKK